MSGKLLIPNGPCSTNSKGKWYIIQGWYLYHIQPTIISSGIGNIPFELFDLPWQNVWPTSMVKAWTTPQTQLSSTRYPSWLGSPGSVEYKVDLNYSTQDKHWTSNPWPSDLISNSMHLATTRNIPPPLSLNRWERIWWSSSHSNWQ